MTERATDDIQARLAGHAARDARAPFLLAPGKPPMSFGSLASRIDDLRERFAAWGLRRGDIVASSVFDRPVAVSLFAAAPAASTFALYADALTVDAYGELLRRMRVRAVMVPAAGAHPLAVAARELGIARIAVEPGDEEAGAFRLALADAGRSLDDAPPHHPPGWAYIGVTSGTTDRPKLVPYAHSSVLHVSAAMGELLHVTPDDTSGLVTPVQLANGQRTALLLPALRGASILCLAEADVDALLDAIRDDRLSFVTASFTILRGLLERAGPGARVRSRRLRFLRIASGALDPPEILALERVFGVPAVCGLATTETGVITHQLLPPHPRTAGSLGRPLLGELRLADASGHEVAQGAVGEVQVRGPNVFDGYLDDAELDRRSRVDGWFRVGDLARTDERGELVLVGRAREIINRGGEKISPLEVDAALRAIAGVADAAAFGVPHPTLGEELVAAVVRVQGAAVAEADVIAAAAVRLGTRRAPRRVWFVDALPRNEAGKLLRSRLAGWVGYEPPAATVATPDDGEPRSPLEAALAGLWSAALGVQDVRRDDRFRDLGGDDARVAQLVADVRAVFGVELAPHAVDGESGTLAGMALGVEAARRERTPR